MVEEGGGSRRQTHNLCCYYCLSTVSSTHPQGMSSPQDTLNLSNLSSQLHSLLR